MRVYCCNPLEYLALIRPNQSMLIKPYSSQHSLTFLLLVLLLLLAFHILLKTLCVITSPPRAVRHVVPSGDGSGQDEGSYSLNAKSIDDVVDQINRNTMTRIMVLWAILRYTWVYLSTFRVYLS